MTDHLAMWWTIPITVERLIGSGPYGDKFAAPTTELGRLSRRTRLVRNSAGEEVTASATWSGPLDTEPIPPSSRITLPEDPTPRISITWGRVEALAITPNHVRIDIE